MFLCVCVFLIGLDFKKEVWVGIDIFRSYVGCCIGNKVYNSIGCLGFRD